MSLKDFWPQSFDKMGKQRPNRERKDTPSELIEAPQDGAHSDSDPTAELDPSLANAFNLMTANVVKVIDEKLSPLTEAVSKLVVELQSAHKRLDKAEARVPAVDSVAIAHEPRITELENQVSALMERLDAAENYSTRLNVRLVGLPEDTESAHLFSLFHR